MELPFDPAIQLLGIHPKKPETPFGKNIYSPVLFAVLFTINSQAVGAAPVPARRRGGDRAAVSVHGGALLSRTRELTLTVCTARMGLEDILCSVR